MRHIEIGFNNTVLVIPDGWDHFVYRGWHYIKDADGHFVVGSQQDLDAALDSDPNGAHRRGPAPREVAR